MTRYNKQPLYDTAGQAPGLSTIADIKENGLALNPIRSISLYSPVSQYPF